MRTRLIVALVAGALLVGAPAARAGAEGAPGGPPPVGAPVAPDPNLAPQAANRLAQIQPIVADIETRANEAAKQRDALNAELDNVLKRLSVGDARLAQLERDAEAAQVRADETKERLGMVSAALYASAATDTPRTSSPGNELDAALSDMRTAQLSASVSIAQKNLLDQFLEQKRLAEKAQRSLREEKRALELRKEELSTRAPQVQQVASDASALADRARRMIAAWQSVQLGSNTPIMGTIVLSADEIAAWFSAKYSPPRTTVPLDVLTKLYIEEGSAEGVRGDIAFAQSVLETGAFSFPSYGQVGNTDNNFAGIGACDSCPNGYGYPDARTGVRAQIQLLRNYADPWVTSATLRNPSVWTKFDSLSVHGKHPTWQSLTGTWATSTTYGPKIFDIYFAMLNWVTDKLLLPNLGGSAGTAPATPDGGKASR